MSTAPAPHHITVNDEPRPLDGIATLAGLALELGLGTRKGIAIALNGRVVPRAAWPTQSLADGDRILVIRATQGG